MNENLTLFLSPQGEIIHVVESPHISRPVTHPKRKLTHKEKTLINAKWHISAIIRSPRTFGLTIDEIISSYDKHSEVLGQEGEAKSEIIHRLFQKGWIRLRRYPANLWLIDTFRLTDKAKDLLYDWANNIIKGTLGFTETNPNLPVKIVYEGGEITKYTLQDIAKDKLFNVECNDSSGELFKAPTDRERSKISPYMRDG